MEDKGFTTASTSLFMASKSQFYETGGLKNMLQNEQVNVSSRNFQTSGQALRRDSPKSKMNESQYQMFKNTSRTYGKPA